MGSIDEFLRTGRLGQIAEGLTTSQARELLGDPEAFNSRGWPQLWKYGSLQLGFHRTSPDEMPFLISTALYFHTTDQSPPTVLNLTGWKPSPACEYAQFQTHLDDVGIGVSGGVLSGARKHLVVGPGVRVTFVDDVLDSIQYHAKREPERKQFLVTARRENFDRIRAEARARGISVSTLCSEWIDDQARGLAMVGELMSTTRPD